MFPGCKGGQCVRLTTLPPSCAVVMKSGNLNFLELSGPLQACNGTALPLPLPIACHWTNILLRCYVIFLINKEFSQLGFLTSTYSALLPYRERETQWDVSFQQQFSYQTGNRKLRDSESSGSKHSHSIT